MEDSWGAVDVGGKKVVLPKWMLEIKKYIRGLNGVAGYYSIDKKTVFLNNEYNDKVLDMHEYAHGMTDADYGLSPKAISLYKKAYKPSGGKEDRYLSRPTELDARRINLINDAIKLKIWNYGDKFTKKHYDLLIESLKEGKLSFDSKDYIEHIKPEYFEKLMNEIALNDLEEVKKEFLV
jgi:hypothetical protein